MPLCKKCTRTSKLVCPTCKRCGRCRCSCVECDYCTRKYGKSIKHSTIVPCEYCGVCRRACECKHRSAAHVLDSSRLSPAFGGIHLLNSNNRAVSVEVELNDFKGLNKLAYQNFTYKMVRDGSVRGSQMEMVISGLRGDKVISAMAELAVYMEVKGAKHDNTCGLHVHVDSRDLSWWNIRALTLLWEKFAREFAYPLIHPDREGNHQCAQIWTHPAWNKVSKALQTAHNSGEIKRCVYKLCGVTFTGDYEADKRMLNVLKHNKYGLNGHDINNIRYYDLNLFSHIFRGTVEFRSMHMTSDPIELVGWPMLCLGLVTLSTSKGEQWLKSCTMQDIYLAMPPVVKEFLKSKSNQFKDSMTCAA